jgi:6-phosphogluconate dehydrogenase
MQIGIVGLGRMGSGIARRLLRAGHEALVYDRDPGPGRTLEAEGARAAPSLKALVEGLTSRPRAVWCMLPAGAPTEETVSALADLLERGDVVIDGGNSFYKDDIRRAKSLSARGVDYVDCGTSGGVWGLERGFCMMIGGPKAAVDRLDPIFLALAPGESGIPRTNGRDGRDPRVELGYLHAGPAGAGHFVKMIHNGVEYGLMQAYAEGFDILKGKSSPLLASEERFDLDVADVAEVWRRGSVISSWLLDLSAIALAKDPSLSDFSGAVEDSGEGRWTLEAAIEEAVPADVLASALFTRFRSRQEHTFAERLLSAMRFGFGGHLESHGPHAARNPAPPETPPHAGSEPPKG